MGGATLYNVIPVEEPCSMTLPYEVPLESLPHVGEEHSMPQPDEVLPPLSDSEPYPEEHSMPQPYEVLPTPRTISMCGAGGAQDDSTRGSATAILHERGSTAICSKVKATTGVISTEAKTIKTKSNAGSNLCPIGHMRLHPPGRVRLWHNHARLTCGLEETSSSHK